MPDEKDPPINHTMPSILNIPTVTTLYDSESGLCIQWDSEENAYSITTGDEQERLIIKPEMFQELQNVRFT